MLSRLQAVRAGRAARAEESVDDLLYLAAACMALTTHLPLEDRALRLPDDELCSTTRLAAVARQFTSELQLAMAEELTRIDMVSMSTDPLQYSDFEFADLFDGRLFWLLLVHWACDSTALALPSVVAEEAAKICGRTSPEPPSLRLVDPDTLQAMRRALESFVPPSAPSEPLLMPLSPSPLIDTVLGDLEGALTDCCARPEVADTTGEDAVPGPYDDQRHWHSKRKLESKDTDAFVAQVLH
jgi:hypothetical protein